MSRLSIFVGGFLATICSFSSCFAWPANWTSAREHGPGELSAREVCEALETHLKLSDLRLEGGDLETRISQVGGLELPHNDGSPEVSPQVKQVNGSDHWWTVILVTNGYRKTEFLIRQRYDGAGVEVSPIPTSADAGSPILGAWRKYGNMLVGVGILLQSSQHPSAGMEVLSVQPLGLKLIQSFVSEDQFVQAGTGFDPNRSTDLIVRTRIDDFTGLWGMSQAGPWLTQQCRWRLAGGRLHLVGSNLVRNPLYVLDCIAEAVSDHHLRRLSRLIPNAALRSSAMRALLRAFSSGMGTPEKVGDEDELTCRTFRLRRPMDLSARGPQLSFRLVKGKGELASVSYGK